MIRASHATLKMLRAGRPQQILLPAREPRPGALRALCPVIADREYVITAVATDEHRKERLRCTALAVETGPDGGWVVTFRSDVGVETPRFLKARPGGDEGDYTTSPGKAAVDEPEPVDAQALRRIQRDGRTAERVRLDAETRESRLRISRAIDELAARSDLGEVAVRRLVNMRRELRRLESELRGAA